MKRFCLLLFVFFCLGAVAATAQSNGVIDEFLGQEKADYSQAVYLVLAAADLISDTATPAEAVNTLAEKQWGLPSSDAPATITLGQYSYLLMRAFNIPGGLMYRLVPGPRYAVREVAYLGFVTDKPTPYRSLSGEEAMRILGAVLSWKEERL